jgi:hypothetical protein
MRLEAPADEGGLPQITSVTPLHMELPLLSVVVNDSVSSPHPDAQVGDQADEADQQEIVLYGQWRLCFLV